VSTGTLLLEMATAFPSAVKTLAIVGVARIQEPGWPRCCKLAISFSEPRAG